MVECFAGKEEGPGHCQNEDRAVDAHPVPYNGHIRNNNVLPELDGLRAVAAFGILTTHVAFQTGTASGLLERFDFFVAVFFALSAFLLARGEWRGGFYRRRAWRLAPAYLVCVTVVLLALPPLSTVTFPQVIANLFLLQIYIPDGLVEGLTHLWSLCVEVAFYLVLPLYMRLEQHGRGIVIVAAVVCALVWPWLVGGPEPVNLQIWPVSFAPWFAVGLICAELERHGFRPRLNRALCWAGALVIAWFAGQVGPAGLVHPSPSEFNVRVILGACFAALVLAPVALDPRESVLSSRPMRALGRWSYSIFLWHVAVLYFAFPVLGVPLFSGHVLLVWLFTAVVSTAVAYMSFELVETAATARQPAKAKSHESPA